MLHALPECKKPAKMLKHLTLEELQGLQSKLDRPAGCDVTGGMFGKMAELSKVVEQGIPVTIVNASKPTTFTKLLNGKK